MAGRFGYELDLNNLTDEEIETVKQQIEQYKEIREVIHQGDMYRLKSPFEGINTVWQYIHKDKVVLMYFSTFIRSGLGKTRVKLCGLDEKCYYTEKNSGRKYSGSYLMNVGLYFEDKQDFKSEILIFKKQNY